ncbi:hypothetical protein QTP70_006278 [Hemibagrus guttatus]|uniref:Integrase zinc-binding domain-containing protein n=1 Tax=Hemibagrus guttatus TaxID=175788 RepID=A0AAE0Q2E3_9TELE|nr:hypothetical protein QTP70_006278 [Hemibagrus guttatus]KAK3536329.1 hypothetical protein QTP86_006008 [Hemibagrus guttatus]
MNPCRPNVRSLRRSGLPNPVSLDASFTKPTCQSHIGSQWSSTVVPGGSREYHHPGLAHGPLQDSKTSRDDTGLVYSWRGPVCPRHTSLHPRAVRGCLPVPVLLGCDWSGFASAMKAPGRAKQPQRPRAQTSSCTAHELQDQDPSFLPYFLVKGGMLYYRTECRGEPCDLLIVTRTRTALLLHLAHTHLLGDHLAPHNTSGKLKDCFTWPGMHAEVQAFCRACPRCQRMTPRKPVPVSLTPLPIIGVPFEHIGIDLVGLLPKSARGHEYILVIMDYTT